MTAHVLIVDDSLTVRMDLADTLDAAGIPSVACATAQEAREALGTTAFSLVILDVILPDADGVDLLKEIRDAPDLARTAVLLLSTEADVRDRIRGLTMGADEYVGKPYDPAYIVTRARQLLRERQENGSSTQDSILVIDDSLTFREELRYVLEAASYRVLTAGSGEEGLRMAADIRPAAIIVDGVLPGIDGATVVRRIRLDAALRRTPCVLLTATEGHHAEIEALEAGADGFVRKEEDIAIVVARLRAVLRSAGGQSGDQVPSSALGPRKILAVDDSETYLHELAEVLRQERYDVVLARSGEEALDLLSVQAVDCILLDLIMPGLSGHEVCQRVKNTPLLRDIPIVMLTARDDREAIIAGLSAGADDYIAKSSDFDVLRARVLAQIRRKQFEDENRRIREQMLRRELEATEARAARELAETRAALVDQLERKNAELAAASIAKSNFLANMSHEIRTPMNAVIGLSDLALKTDLSTKQRDYLVKIRASAKALLGVINDILDLSKIEAGKLALERTEFEVQAVLDDLVAVSALSASAKGLELMFSVDPNLPQVLVGDPLRLGQVLHNLVGNAVKFTNAGEVIVVVGMKSRHGENVVVDVSVADTGIGMSAEVQAGLFQPFTQADSSTTRRFGGTGLGLAISRQLVELMGGVLQVESIPGQGSTFSFSIPLGVGQPIARRHRLKASLLSDLRILIVDDSERSREILGAKLADWRAIPDSVASGEQALVAVRDAIAAGRPYQLVLLDWRMPGMDGIATAQALQKIAPEDVMPKMIMMTAYGNDQLAVHLQDVAVTASLAKPISDSVLLDTLLSVLDREQDKSHAKATVGKAERSPVHGAHVLLVDDNDINREIGVETLAHVGVIVTPACSGEEAIRKIFDSGESFDAVLMDIQMPQMDGLEATRLIRARLGAHPLPIIALTAHALEEERQRCLDAGMDDHVAKPIDPKIIVATLDRWINARRPTAGHHAPHPTPVNGRGPDPSGLPEFLAPFNLATAVVRVGGNKAVLKKLLLMFGDEFGDTVPQLHRLIQDGQIEEAHRIAHSLKSAAAALEAAHVALAADRLEQCLRLSDLTALPPLLGNLETHLTPALAAVRTLAPSTQN